MASRLGLPSWPLPTQDASLLKTSLTATAKSGIYYCIGRVGHGVLTVRFTYREDVIRIIGAGYWRGGKKIYEEQG